MTNTKPLHAPQDQFPVSGGCLTIGGIPLNRLTQRVGSTPFYAYDRDLLTARVAQIRGAMPEGLSLHYSIKANPMPALVHHLAQLVDGFDIASGGEMSIALDTTVEPGCISFTGPGKSEQDLSRAIAAGVVVHVESRRELNVLSWVGERLGIAPKVMIRVNPDFELKASGMKMGGGAKQFGLDAEEVPGLLGELASRDFQFEGFHIFCGSQNLRADLIIEEKSRTLDLALRLAQDSPLPIRAINLGGGFGIPYFPGDERLDIGAIGNCLTERLPGLRAALGEVRLILELGRHLVGEAGIYVTRVIDRKVSRGQVFLVTDGGLNHHLAASGNFGQVIRRNYPVAVGNKMNSKTRETVTVVGPLCTPLDTLAEKMELAVAEVGDLIVVFQSGAYGLTASPVHFLGHPKPEEVLV